MFESIGEVRGCFTPTVTIPALSFAIFFRSVPADDVSPGDWVLHGQVGRQLALIAGAIAL